MTALFGVGWLIAAGCVALWLRERRQRRQGRPPSRPNFAVSDAGRPAHRCALPELRQTEPGRWWIGHTYIGIGAEGRCDCGKRWRLAHTDRGAWWREVDA